MMSWDLFTSVVDQAAGHGCHAITLASRGEPTLHKRFGEMLLYINDKGILDIKINTNATRLTEKLCHEILSANVSTVTLSVDATTKETYERIRVRGKFDEVLNNIQMFNQIRDKHYSKHKTSTRISGVAVKGTQSPEEMQVFWSNHVDQVSIRQEIPRWNSYGNPVFHRESVCKLLYERIYVWYDGICNPCDFDYKSYLALGDATKSSISDIWLGETYQQLRAAHENKQRSCIIPCDRCPF
jgi:MoaA/NifB/PqqE/SkfB family radical SAM enzyme